MSTPEKAAPVRLVPLAALITVGGLMVVLDLSLIHAGLDPIAGTLNASLSDVRWVVNGYLMALAAAQPAAPFLQRRVGASRLWRWSLVGFLLASLLGAFAPSLPVLVVARAVQGVCGGWFLLAGQRVLAEAAGSRHLGGVLSVAALALVPAAVLGPVLGGLIVDNLSWRWLFLVNLPLGGLAAVLAPRLLPTAVPDHSARLDVPGLTLLAAGLPTVLCGLGQPGLCAPPDPSWPWVAAVGALLVLAFVVTASRGRADRPAALDLSLFFRRPYAAAQATVFFAALSLVGGWVLLPRCYETLCVLSEGSTNRLLLVYGAGAVVAIPVAGRLADRLGDGVTCVLGLTLLTLATAPFVFLSADSDFVTVEILQALRGVGAGLTSLPTLTGALRATPGHLADSTATANILGRLGGGLGGALVALLLARVDSPLLAFQRAHAVLVVSALCALLTAACARSERLAPAWPRR